MIDLPKPGAYVVRAPDADAFSGSVVQHWLDSQEETPFKACLWLTARPTRLVRQLLEPYLLNTASAPKGLDVISVRRLLGKGSTSSGMRDLCRSLNTVLALKPALVVIDHAALWFQNTGEELANRNPMAQMHLLQQWARYARAHVVAPVENELPEWCTFADGLAEVDSRGQFEFQPWWPTQWGMQTSLWNEPSGFSELPMHQVLDSRQFSQLKQLAQTCHQLRFGGNPLHGLHVQAHGEISPRDASVLLRMGADTVWMKKERIDSWLGVPAGRVEVLTPPDMLPAMQDSSFARDLHEVFMPGQLTVVPNPVFSTRGLMMLQLARRWGMHCTLVRLSLLPHIAAQTALRLANWSHATCVFTATREAIYLLKTSLAEPEETAYRQWLESCFREKLSVLFSGDIQFQGEETQVQLLTELHEEPEPLTFDELMGNDTDEEARLAELWNHAQQMPDSKRPWGHRLDALLAGEMK
ncbi:MAG TPA: hypothetical protein VFV28_09595 [Limnobacter sp.]|nr:hypothetical protein [Limnobacter sp.]